MKDKYEIGKPVPLKLVLERLMANMGTVGIDPTSKIIDMWPDIVGEELAQRISAIAIRGSELVVQVDDPAWASQLAWLEKELLGRINSLIEPEKITGVKARVVRSEEK